MKYKLVVVIYMTFLCSSVVIGDTRLEENAQKLVSQYLTALVQGNTELLLDILGGGLLESRRTLLQNPDYSTYLADVYVDASVSVTGSRQLSASSVAVDVVIEKSIDEQFGLIFLVELDKNKGKKLLIVAEQDAERK
ncbi:MAG: hypothetical protein QNL62_14090 [Gammaproteobacteria bacterium]|nr:hypothetical protein [Gammaproteobacteria bacterium]